MSERSELRDGIIAFIIYALLIIFSVIATPLAIVSMALLPLPVIVYTAMYTRKAGALLVLCLTIISFVFGPFWAIVTLMCAGAGWGMGQFHHRERRSIRGLLLTGTVTLVMGFFVLYALLSSIFDFNLAHEMEQQWTRATAAYQEMAGQMGVELNEDDLSAVGEMMVALLPFVLLTMSGVTALANHGIARLVLRRFGISTAQLPPFRTWTFPRSLLAWYIISIIISSFSQSGTYWHSVGLTASWLIQLLFVVQALSLLTALLFHYARIKTAWLIGLAVLMLPFIVIALMFLYFPLSLLGMLEIGFRFRDKLARSTKSTDSRRD